MRERVFNAIIVISSTQHTYIYIYEFTHILAPYDDVLLGSKDSSPTRRHPNLILFHFILNVYSIINQSAQDR